MRLIRCVPALLAAALGCQAAPPPDTSASAKQAIDAANAQSPRLTSSGHADSIAEIYAADAVIMPPNMATMRRTDAVRTSFPTINTIDTRPTQTPHADTALPTGSAAIETGKWHR